MTNLDNSLKISLPSFSDYNCYLAPWLTKLSAAIDNFCK